jgi:hypothetical protein
MGLDSSYELEVANRVDWEVAGLWKAVGLKTVGKTHKV